MSEFNISYDEYIVMLVEIPDDKLRNEIVEAAKKVAETFDSPRVNTLASSGVFYRHIFEKVLSKDLELSEDALKILNAIEADQLYDTEVVSEVAFVKH